MSDAPEAVKRFARVVRRFEVGHTTNPSRLIGVEFWVDNADESGQEPMLFVLEPSEIPDLIALLQKTLPKASQ